MENELVKIETAPIVRCVVCNKPHDPDKYSYVMLKGDIYCGKDKPIFCGNLSEDNRLEKIPIYCLHCFESQIRSIYQLIRRYYGHY